MLLDGHLSRSASAWHRHGGDDGAEAAMVVRGTGDSGRRGRFCVQKNPNSKKCNRDWE